ncbi:MAG TPA: PDZ domain-containing protein, partial [Pyrinomonadaceae bacterium]|nr:PDZ domain-containing protein [Pyrinomonadaceae bacterium]
KSQRQRAQTMVFPEMFGGGSYLGVQTQEITRENFSKFGLGEVRGVGVEKVLENSPAAQAGLQNGDVIVRFEDEEITSTRKLSRLISEIAPDHQARLTVLRGGSEREITVTMGKRPAPRFEDGFFELRVPPVGGEMPPVRISPAPRTPRTGETPPVRTFPPVGELNGSRDFFMFRGDGRHIGAALTPLTKQLADYFGINEGRGLLINEVRADSPAAKAGLKAGDVIVEAEGREVKGMGDLLRAIGEKKEGEVTLTVVRDRNRQTVRVMPEKMKDDGGFFFEFDDRDGALLNVPPIAPQTPGVKPLNAPANLPSVPLLVPTRIL